MTRPVFGPQDPEDSRSVIRSIDEDGIAVFGQVGIQEIAYQGRFGAIARSTTLNSIAIGDHYFTLDTDTGMFRIGDDILMTALDDPSSCFMWGEIIDADTVDEPKRIRVYVDDISNLIGDFANWEIQVVARPKPGIEKDTSQSSVDPFGAGPFTFEVTAGKFFPIGGQLLLKPLTDRRVALLGRVLAFNGTTLIVEKNETNATGSQAYDSWAVALLDAPPADLPALAISGLVAERNSASTHGIKITAGSVMDSNGDTLLTLPATIVKLTSATFVAGNNQGGAIVVALPGTAASAGTTLNGTGTNFNTSLTTGSEMLDLSAQGYNISAPSMVGDGSGGSAVNTVTGATTLTTGIDIGMPGVQPYRGATAKLTGTDYQAVICLIRKDDDGSIDVCFSSFTLSGLPDLPAGYSKYRIIAYIAGAIGVSASVSAYEIVQPLHSIVQPYAPRNQYYVTFTGDQTFLPNSRRLIGSTSNSFSQGVSTVEIRRAALTGDISAPFNSNTTTAQPAMITGKTEKTTLVDDDLFLIADSEDSFNLKKVKNINAGGGGGGGGVPTDWGLITDPIDASAILDFGTIV